MNSKEKRPAVNSAGPNQRRVALATGAVATLAALALACPAACWGQANESNRQWCTDSGCTWTDLHNGYGNCTCVGEEIGATSSAPTPDPPKTNYAGCPLIITGPDGKILPLDSTDASNNTGNTICRYTFVQCSYGDPGRK